MTALGGSCTYLIHVSNDPVLRKRPLCREVVLLVEADTPWSIVHGPVVVGAKIPGRVILIPSIAPSNHTLRGIKPAATEIVEIPRHDMIRLVR